MDDVKRSIETALAPLVGLRLSIARRAAVMRIFHFGPIRAIENGAVGTYALHLQCPWRLEAAHKIVTGNQDLWEPSGESGRVDIDEWDYDTDGNAQDEIIHQWMGDAAGATRSAVNTTERLEVLSVSADDYCGVLIELSGNFQIHLFPAGSRGEYWRLLRPESGDPHFVVQADGCHST